MQHYLIYRYLNNRYQDFIPTEYPADQIWPQLIHQFKIIEQAGQIPNGTTVDFNYHQLTITINTNPIIKLVGKKLEDHEWLIIN